LIDENSIARLVKQKVVTATFRRLAPEKKEQIYRASIGLFGEYGYDGLAVDKICTMAGISKGSFFQYFPSKSHLLEFTILIFDETLSGWIGSIRDSDRKGLARQRLIHLYRSLTVNAQMDPNDLRFYLFATNALNHAGVAIEGIEMDRHLNEYVAEIISRGEETGEIRGDFDAELTGYLVSLIMAGIIQRQFSQKRLPPEQVEEYLISFLFDGVKG